MSASHGPEVGLLPFVCLHISIRVCFLLIFCKGHGVLTDQAGLFVVDAHDLFLDLLRLSPELLFNLIMKIGNAGVF